LRKLQWIDLNSSPKHLLDLQRISIWRQTWIELRAELENIERTVSQINT
jgi:hypothetical protein